VAKIPANGFIENRYGREGNPRNSDIGIHSYIDSSCSKTRQVTDLNAVKLRYSMISFAGGE
jgi:hypothetical protein